MIYIVGIGPGHKDFILPKAVKILNKSNIIVGFSRAIDSLDFIDSKKLKVNSLKGIIDIINSKKNDEYISIVASGDPTFFGITEYIKKSYGGVIKVIPGISSFQYLTCRLSESWSNAYVGSLHGREEEFIEKVKENKLSIWLTDKKNTPSYLCEKLKENSVKCKVVVGENLSYENERIIKNTPTNIIGMEFSNLSVFLVKIEE